MLTLYLMGLCSLSFVGIIISHPVFPEDDLFDERGFADEPLNITNVTVPKDLYIIRTVIYEVGILTDVTNSTDNSTDTNEEVDLTFYNPTHNGTTYNLDNIPIPVQTNISGMSVTGIVPTNLGNLSFKNGHPVLNGAVLPNAVVEVKQNVSTTSSEQGMELLKQLAPFLDISSNKKL